MLPIDFSKIDEEMIELIKVLNYECNILTKYCCSGHGEKDRFYVMLDDSQSFEKIHPLAISFSRHFQPINFRFYYTIRNTSIKDPQKVGENWIIETNGLKSHSERLRLIDELVSFFRKG